MTIQELKDRIYNDFIAAFKNAITPLKKSFFEQLSNAQAATFQLLYIYLDRILNDSFLTTCTKDRVLGYFAPLKNIERKDPTKSTGIIKFTGVETTVIPSGTILLYNDLEYQTTADGTITAGIANIDSESVGTGTLNNTLASIDMFLASPIVGIDNKAISVLGFSGAIDKETIESVRTRTKQKFATTTQVDNDNYYKSLANELSNVKATFISDLKNGAGTFGVTILTFSNDGVAVQADIDEVGQYFIDNDAVPTYVEAEYFLPTITDQAFTIQLAINDTTNQDSVSQSIRDYLYLEQKPSTTFEYSGLSDFLQTLGARLVSPLPTDTDLLADDEVLDLGTVTWI